MNNTVILNKDASTWPMIKKYWEEKGVDTHPFNGTSIGHYYGVIDGKFCSCTKFFLDRANAEIIELPEEPKEIQLSEETFIKHFEKFRHGMYRASLESFLETGKLSGSLLLEVREMLKPQPKEEKKLPEKPILRKAYELICQLKTERLQRAGCSDMEVLTYINADKDLKEIESHLSK